MRSLEDGASRGEAFLEFATPAQAAAAGAALDGARAPAPPGARGRRYSPNWAPRSLTESLLRGSGGVLVRRCPGAAAPQLVGGGAGGAALEAPAPAPRGQLAPLPPGVWLAPAYVPGVNYAAPLPLPPPPAGFRPHGWAGGPPCAFAPTPPPPAAAAGGSPPPLAPRAAAGEGAAAPPRCVAGFPGAPPSPPLYFPGSLLAATPPPRCALGLPGAPPAAALSDPADFPTPAEARGAPPATPPAPPALGGGLSPAERSAARARVRRGAERAAGRGADLGAHLLQLAVGSPPARGASPGPSAPASPAVGGVSPCSVMPAGHTPSPLAPQRKSRASAAADSP
jgi:hypothetical protein